MAECIVFVLTLCVVRAQYPNNTKHQLSTEKEKKRNRGKRKEKNMYLGFVNFFLKKGRDKERNESTLLTVHARALHEHLLQLCRTEETHT